MSLTHLGPRSRNGNAKSRLLRGCGNPEPTGSTSPSHWARLLVDQYRACHSSESREAGPCSLHQAPGLTGRICIGAATGPWLDHTDLRHGQGRTRVCRQPICRDARIGNHEAANRHGWRGAFNGGTEALMVLEEASFDGLTCGCADCLLKKAGAGHKRGMPSLAARRATASSSPR